MMQSIMLPNLDAKMATPMVSSAPKRLSRKLRKCHLSHAAMVASAA